MSQSSHHSFHYERDQFLCEDVSVASIAERFGTPAYVYSQRTMLGNYERLRAMLAGIPGMICYSVKANSHLRILGLLRQAGAGFDVVSGGELARALRAGAAPGTIVFSGVGKTQDEIDAGLAAGILMFNVESAGELALIESRAQALRTVASISIRVNPDVEADTHPYISTGQMIHKFGVPKDEAPELYRRAARSPHLKVQGVACHIGSQILEPSLSGRRWMKSWEWRAHLAAEGMPVRSARSGRRLGNFLQRRTASGLAPPGARPGRAVARRSGAAHRGTRPLAGGRCRRAPDARALCEAEPAERISWWWTPA